MTGIVNYGAGNIYSVLTAVRKCGEDAFIVEKAGDLSSADSIILPGVGAFGDGMNALSGSGLKEALVKSVSGGKPFLGICLGMQLLFSHSDEGDCDGFGIINGMVRRFSFPAALSIKVPHMGWNVVEAAGPGRELFAGIPSNSMFYFAHSFYATPDDPGAVAGRTVYGHPFASVVKIRNIAGVQFHPEKSGDWGLLFIKNFLEGKWLVSE